MESKALHKSKKTVQIEKLESSRENHERVVVIRADSVEKDDLKPN